MILINWLQEHWPEVLAYLGIGGSSGILGKKLTDKKQDAKIKDHGQKINDHDQKINDHQDEIKSLKKITSVQSKVMLRLENDLKHNTDWDKQLREDLKEKLNKLEESQRDQFNKIELRQNQLRDMLFQFINQTK